MREKNVLDFYVMCNKLKNVVRTGWLDWGVERERVESIAEHIFGVQMLAIGMWNEYKYDIDISKVILMLAIHETEEILIGDLTCFQIDKQQKEELGHKAVSKIFSKLGNPKQIENLIYEFDERKTKEAQFAYQCDKLECDIQAKLYDEEHCVDLNKQENNKTAQNELVKKLLEETENSWSKMWIRFGQIRYPYDKNFLEISNYVLNNKISTPTNDNEQNI